MGQAETSRSSKMGRPIRRPAVVSLPVAEVARLRGVEQNPKSGDFGYGNFDPAAQLI